MDFEFMPIPVLCDWVAFLECGSDDIVAIDSDTLIFEIEVTGIIFL